MNDDDLKQIERLIRKHKPETGFGLIMIIIVLFLNGCFKGCGY
jgi:hypothetical protein